MSSFQNNQGCIAIIPSAEQIYLSFMVDPPIGEENCLLDLAGHDEERLTAECLILRPQPLGVVVLVDIDDLLAVCCDHVDGDAVIAAVSETDELA